MAEPGTPSARLEYLLRELGKRFPTADHPFASDPPELRFLAEIDKQLSNNLPGHQIYEYEKFTKWHTERYPHDPITGPSATLRWAGWVARSGLQK